MLAVLVFLLGLVPLCLAVEAPPASIRVVMDDNYPPFAFRGEEGRLQGILVDQWELWSRHTGVKAELVGTVWNQALRRMEEGEFDVIDTIFLTPKRAGIFAFTKPHATLEAAAFYPKDLSGIVGVESLRPFAVGVKAGDAVAELLKQKGVTNLVDFHNYEDLVESARQGQISVFVMDKPPALYFIHRKGMQNLLHVSEPIYRGQFHRAVPKGREALLTLVEEGFARISRADYSAIEEKWRGALPSGRERYWTAVLVLLGSVAGLGLALIVWNGALRRAVKEKAARLEQEIVTSREREQSRAESEHRFRGFIEHFPGLLFLRDSHGGAMLLSRRFQESLGRENRDSAHSSEAESTPGFIAQLTAHEEEVVQLAPGESQVSELRIGDRSFLVHRFPVPQGGRTLLGGLALDITERKQAEERQRRFEAQLQYTQKLESLGVLAGGIAHDFNNLLTTILGNIDLACMRFPRESEAVSQLQEAARAGRRAAELCRQMLAYAGKGRYVVTEVALNHLLRDMERIIGVSITKDASLRWELAPALPRIHADPAQMRQLVMNLVVNASEALGHRPGVITVATRAVRCSQADLASPWQVQAPPEGWYVCLEVSDTGCGMDDQTMSRIFEPFFSTKFIGRGLGLPASLGIVRSHQGAIQVSSEIGRGSRFRVLLPAKEAMREVDDKPTRPTVSASTAGGIALLAEDETSVRLITRRMLERLGYRVIEAADGLSAIEHFKENARSINVVLLDITMPGMSGEEVLAELRRLRPDLRVVVASGHEEQEIATRLSGLGASAFIQKPFSMEALAAALNSTVQRDG